MDEECFEFLLLPCLGEFDEPTVGEMCETQFPCTSSSDYSDDCSSGGAHDEDTLLFSQDHEQVNLMMVGLKEMISRHPLTGMILESLLATHTHHHHQQQQRVQLPPLSTTPNLYVSSSLVDIYCLVSNYKLQISKIHLDFYKSTLDLTPTRGHDQHHCHHHRHHDAIQSITKILNEGVAQRRKHMKHPRESTLLLDKWFRSHISRPYPSEDEKEWLGNITGLTALQVNYWFINARKRRLRQKGTPPTQTAARARYHVQKQGLHLLSPECSIEALRQIANEHRYLVA